MLEDKITRDASNRTISLTDTIAAAGGAAYGDSAPEKLAGSALLALLNKGGRTFGKSMQARGANTLSKLAGKSAQFANLAKQNPMLAQVLANRISNPGKFEESSDPVLNNPEILRMIKESPELLDSIQDEKLRAAIQKKISRGPADNAIMRRKDR